MPETMTQEDSDKHCYHAYFNLCKEMGDMTSLEQLRIMVRSIGAERTYALTSINSDLPEDIKSIMYNICKHIERTNVTN